MNEPTPEQMEAIKTYLRPERAIKSKTGPEEAAMDEARTKLTTDPTDPRLGHGSDSEPGPENETYLVLSEEERAKGFVRPYRDAYMHDTCGTVTTMGRALSETYARQPNFYGSTYCCHCQMHKPVSEFTWTADGERVGS